LNEIIGKLQKQFSTNNERDTKTFLLFGYWEKLIFKRQIK